MTHAASQLLRARRQADPPFAIHEDRMLLIMIQAVAFLIVRRRFALLRMHWRPIVVHSLSWTLEGAMFQETLDCGPSWMHLILEE